MMSNSEKKTIPLVPSAFIVMIMFTLHCSRPIQTITWPTTKYKLNQSAASHAEVGAAEVDITPILPGANAGFSVDGKTANGYHNRLKARAFYIGPQAANGPPLVMVQLDLLSGSYLLHRGVAQKLAEEGIINPQGLLLAGTHSHGGPGNYFASAFYNAWAGTASGLNQPLVEFLTDRIVQVVRQAYNTRRPGTVTIGTTEVYNLTRNRSLKAFQANRNHLEDQRGPLAAINPLLTVIRFDAFDHGQLWPLAGLVTFSIHGTAVSPSDVYHGDLFAYASGASQKSMQDQPLRGPWQPVFGYINRTHGDHSPNYTKQGQPEAQRIGVTLSESAMKLFYELKPQPQKPLTTFVAARELDLLNETTLCPAKVGMALVGGAEDGPNPLLHDIPWFAEGWPQSQSHYACQGRKRVLGSVLQPFILAAEDFPRFAWLQVMRIGDFALVSLPFEITYEMGARLKKSLITGLENISGNHLHWRDDQAAVISCANGYFGYLTTEEEYGEQHYEGGHTLFGPGSGGFFAQELTELLASSPSSSSIEGVIPSQILRLPLGEFESYTANDSLVWQKTPQVTSWSSSQLKIHGSYFLHDGQVPPQIVLLGSDQTLSNGGTWQMLATDDYGAITVSRSLDQPKTYLIDATISYANNHHLKAIKFSAHQSKSQIDSEVLYLPERFRSH